MVENRVPKHDERDYDYEERAGILEYMANMTRPEAERRARQMHPKAGEQIPLAFLSAGRGER